MKKRRMKADGVDQLFEIVKAVQMGQDPEEMLKKKQAESAPLADSPKSNPGIGALDDEDDEWESAGIGAKLKAAREARRMSSEEENVPMRRISREKLSGAEDTWDSGDMKRITVDDPEEETGAAGWLKGRMDARKKKAESAAEAVRLEKENADFRKKKETASESVQQSEDGWNDNDDFEKLLNDDAEQDVDAGAFAEKLGSVLQAAAGFFARPKKQAAGKKKAKADKESEELMQLEEKEDSEHQEQSEEKDGSEELKQSEEKDGSERMKQSGGEGGSEHQTGSAETGNTEYPADLSVWHAPITAASGGDLIEMDTEDGELTDEELQARMEDGKTLDRILDIPGAAAERVQDGADRDAQDPAGQRIEDGADRDVQGLAGQRMQDSTDQDMQEMVSRDGEEMDAEHISEDDVQTAESSEKTAKAAGRKPSARRISGSLSQSEQEAEKSASAKQRSVKKDSPVSVLIDKVQDSVSGLMERLREKEIHRRELIMIAVGLVLVILMGVMGVNYIKAVMADKKKSENVTADAGLKITVEKEPDQWCRTYPVSMRVRVKGGTASKVTIDGAIYEPDENGMITVRARDALMNAVVESETGTLNAQIEFPKIDAQSPVVSAAREQDTITLTAADGRSGISRVWYAAVGADDYLELPLYKEYTEPFLYEEDTMYYFYAEDLAGNRSMPVKTTMEEASALVLGSSELNLFPGESVYLSVDGDPSGALLNNLSFESMNPAVVSVTSSGLVTALDEGTTAIKVRADGLAEVMCTAVVSRTRTVTIGAIGDCTLGSDAYFNTNVNFQAFETMNGTSYFFRNVKDILKNDDATFANLECVFTDLNTRENKQYAFKGAPYYTEILQEGSVEVVTLANNHSSDYGEQSQKDTKQYLTNAGIDYCIGDSIAVQEIKGIRTAFIGIYVLRDGLEREDQVRQTIAEAKALGAQLIIVGFHWGSEKATQPDQIQTTLAHLAVDEGADLVVGHHPHVLQGIEKYNGKYIVYSLGNFCFGGNTNPSDTDTIIFRQTFTISEGAVLEDDQIEIVPCSISGTSSYNDYQPVPVSGAEADRIMDRLNEYSKAFEQRFTASTGL